MRSQTLTPFRAGALTCAALVILVLPSGPASAAQPKAPPVSSISKEATDEIMLAPVVVDGAELFRVRGITAYPAEKRAVTIAARIEQIAANRDLSPKLLKVAEVEQGSRIELGDQVVLIVTDGDAQVERLDRKILADAYVVRIGEAIEDYRHNRSVTTLMRNGMVVLVVTAAFALLLWLGGRMMRKIDVALERRTKEKLEEVEAHSLRLLSATKLWRALHGLHSLLWSVAVLIAVVVYLEFLLQIFPWTRWLGRHLLVLLIDPLRSTGRTLLEIIPDLLFIAILVLVTRYILKAIRLLFSGIAQGYVAPAGFDREWAWPTYRLVRLLVLVLATVVAYPYIPGSNSDAFKGISVFLGIILSLGSSSLIGNVIAGYSMIYRRAFRIGDRVRVNEHTGDVVEARLLVTRVRTPKNEDVIIPNSVMLSSSVINYSTLAREGKLILYVAVGIGYETPWRQVEAMLLQAAERTEGLLSAPKPFVLQRALGDFAVTYEINAYCADAQAMDHQYTRLHQSILDVFNEYGVQIMTPAYVADPGQPKLVPKDQWYAAPAPTPR